MGKKITLRESELVSLIERIINEQYNPDKLYNRWYIVDRLNNAPLRLRKYIKTLPEIDCYDDKGNKKVCTTIPEVIYVYLTGRY
jgi:hypothetical protein